MTNGRILVDTQFIQKTSNVKHSQQQRRRRRRRRRQQRGGACRKRTASNVPTQRQYSVVDGRVQSNDVLVILDGVCLVAQRLVRGRAAEERLYSVRDKRQTSGAVADGVSVGLLSQIRLRAVAQDDGPVLNAQVLACQCGRVGLDCDTKSQRGAQPTPPKCEAREIETTDQNKNEQNKTPAVKRMQGLSPHSNTAEIGSEVVQQRNDNVRRRECGSICAVPASTRSSRAYAALPAVLCSAHDI